MLNHQATSEIIVYLEALTFGSKSLIKPYDTFFMRIYIGLLKKHEKLFKIGKTGTDTSFERTDALLPRTDASFEGMDILIERMDAMTEGMDVSFERMDVMNEGMDVSFERMDEYIKA